MQKIKSLFIRDEANPRLVTREVETDCKWVIDGEGVATIKVDGTACLVRNGRFYRRHQLKQKRPKPESWLHWTFDTERESGHGWLLISDSPADDYHREGWQQYDGDPVDGTYELIGPKIQKNPYKLTVHQIWPHGKETCPRAPRTFDALSLYLRVWSCEGFVWHHPDGRMAKIKRRDFGHPWPVKP